MHTLTLALSSSHTHPLPHTLTHTHALVHTRTHFISHTLANRLSHSHTRDTLAHTIALSLPPLLGSPVPAGLGTPQLLRQHRVSRPTRKRVRLSHIKASKTGRNWSLLVSGPGPTQSAVSPERRPSVTRRDSRSACVRAEGSATRTKTRAAVAHRSPRCPRHTRGARDLSVPPPDLPTAPQDAAEDGKSLVRQDSELAGLRQRGSSGGACPRRLQSRRRMPRSTRFPGSPWRRVRASCRRRHGKRGRWGEREWLLCHRRPRRPPTVHGRGYAVLHGGVRSETRRIPETLGLTPRQGDP